MKLPCAINSWAEPNLIPIKTNPNHLDRLNWFRRLKINSSRTTVKRRKMPISVKLLAKKRYNNLYIRLSKSSASESKSLQSRNSLARRKERPNRSKLKALPTWKCGQVRIRAGNAGIPMSAPKHTYQLHGMASTVSMRTVILLRQWQPYWQLFRSHKESNAISMT